MNNAIAFNYNISESVRGLTKKIESYNFKHCFYWLNYTELYLYNSLTADTNCSLMAASGMPNHELVQFKVNHHFGFSAKEIENYSFNETEQLKLTVVVNNIGVTGKSGLMPLHYTRDIVNLHKHKDFAMSDFFDVFNNRLMAYYFSAWSKYKLPVQYARAKSQEKIDPITTLLQSLSGDESHDVFEARVFYAGMYAQKNRSSANLSKILSHYLNATVDIEEFIPQWLNIEERDRFQLGRNNKQLLGDGVLLGRRFLDINSKIIVKVSEINATLFEKLLPGREVYDEVTHLIQKFIPNHIDVEMALEARPAETPLKLDGSRRLTRDCWLVSKNYKQHTKQYAKFKLNK